MLGIGVRGVLRDRVARHVAGEGGVGAGVFGGELAPGSRHQEAHPGEGERVGKRGDAALGGLRRLLPWKVALGISSAVYALVHFLQRSELTGPVRWNSGLALLPQILAGFADWHQLVPGFFNLTLAGILLGLAYQRTGNLYFSIGLHAGWIFWLKIYGAFTTAAAPAVSWFWGTGKMIDGWLALVVLSLTLALLNYPPLLSRQPPRSPP